MSVPLFSMATRRKHVSTSKHSQELSVILLPVVWETMEGVCAPSKPELEDREEQGRENTWCKVRGRTWCREVSACSSTHGAGGESPPGENLLGKGSKHSVKMTRVMLPSIKSRGQRKDQRVKH